MPFLRAIEKDSLLLELYVQPRAKVNELAGLHDGALKLRLTTPPVDGKANKAVIAYLAQILKRPKSAISIKSGQKNRRKQLLINGIAADKARLLLDMS